MKNPLTISEVAERTGIAAETLRLWARTGKLAGAKQIESPRGSYWHIPEASTKGLVKSKRGRPRKAAA